MTDGDGFARLDAAVPLLGVDRVGGGVDVYARGDEAVGNLSSSISIYHLTEIILIGERSARQIRPW